jgi:hypothetical protein
MWATQAFGQSMANSPLSSIFESKLASSLVHPDTVTISNLQSFSQIADGAGWRTTVILANADTVPANFTLNFWNADGSPLPLSIGGQGMPTVTGTIPVNGTVTIASDGTSGTLSTGWGQLVTSNEIGGTVIFRETVPGQQASEAAVPILRPVSSTTLLPYDNTNGLVTSLALVNPDPINQAPINATIFDQNGNQIASGLINLPPQGQQPFALPTQFPGANNQKGVAVFSNPTGGSITGLGLRFSGAPFTSIQMLTPGAVSQSQSFSQIADGAGWKTTIVLVNADTVPAFFTLSFWKADGTALPLSIGGVGTPVIQGTIPVNGTMTIASDGTSGDLSTGWGQLVTGNAIGGSVIFRESVPGQQASEAAVPILRPVSPTLLLPYDNTGPQTSLALVNPDPVNAAPINASIYDQNGNLLASGVINLPPQGQQPFQLSTQFPATNGQSGLAVFSNPTGGAITGLGLRFSGAPFTSIQMLTPGAQ